MQEEKLSAICPYLTMDDPKYMVDFIEKVFGGELLHADMDDKGEIIHAKLRIRDSILMIGQARGEWTNFPGQLYLMLEEVDKYYNMAIEGGAQSLMVPEDQAYGHRTSGVKDKMNNVWWISSKIQTKA